MYSENYSEKLSPRFAQFILEQFYTNFSIMTKSDLGVTALLASQHSSKVLMDTLKRAYNYAGLEEIRDTLFENEFLESLSGKRKYNFLSNRFGNLSITFGAAPLSSYAVAAIQCNVGHLDYYSRISINFFTSRYMSNQCCVVILLKNK